MLNLKSKGLVESKRNLFLYQSWDALTLEIPSDHEIGEQHSLLQVVPWWR